MQIPFISFTFNAKDNMVSCVYFWLEHCIPNTVSVGKANSFRKVENIQNIWRHEECVIEVSNKKIHNKSVL